MRQMTDDQRLAMRRSNLAYRQTEAGKAARKRYRDRNRLQEQAKSHLHRRRLIIESKSHPCMDCGGTFDQVCMDSDHRPGEEKLFTIGQSSRRSLDAIRKEIAKCDVVCSNCHRLRTFRLRNHREWTKGVKIKNAEVRPIAQQPLFSEAVSP